jgi:hypothetical protein
MKKILYAMLVAVIVCSPAWVPAADVDLPVPIQQYGNVSYYSGGVGADERRQLPQLYLLKVVFKTDGGHLLSDAEVTISAGGKTLFRGRAGKARSARGVRLEAGKLRTVYLMWKTTDVNMGL